MLKEQLLDSLIKEMKICMRLSTKIPADQLDFRPKEGLRSNLELLQYLSWCGTGMLLFWTQDEEKDFRAYFGKITGKAKEMKASDFTTVMNSQIETASRILNRFQDNDLDTFEITFPWGAKGKLREGILETCIKWTTAYKLQLFFYLKLCSDQKLGTPDAWRLTEIES
jgi:hypothetical protein